MWRFWQDWRVPKLASVKFGDILNLLLIKLIIPDIESTKKWTDWNWYITQQYYELQVLPPNADNYLSVLYNIRPFLGEFILKLFFSCHKLGLYLSLRSLTSLWHNAKNPQVSNQLISRLTTAAEFLQANIGRWVVRFPCWVHTFVWRNGNRFTLMIVQQSSDLWISNNNDWNLENHKSNLCKPRTQKISNIWKLSNSQLYQKLNSW